MLILDWICLHKLHIIGEQLPIIGAIDSVDASEVSGLAMDVYVANILPVLDS